MKKKSLKLVVLAAVTVWGIACEGTSDDDGNGTGADADTDVDTDADTDVDADADADADTDTDADADPDGESDDDTGTDTWGFAITERVKITTSMGEMTVGLFGDDGPITVENFITYVDASFYDGLVPAAA